MNTIFIIIIVFYLGILTRELLVNQERTIHNLYIDVSGWCLVLLTLGTVVDVVIGRMLFGPVAVVMFLTALLVTLIYDAADTIMVGWYKTVSKARQKIQFSFAVYLIGLQAALWLAMYLYYRQPL